jgi:hypothetical protein
LGGPVEVGAEVRIGNGALAGERIWAPVLP